jgi:hypothetical protein
MTNGAADAIARGLVDAHGLGRVVEPLLDIGMAQARAARRVLVCVV